MKDITVSEGLIKKIRKIREKDKNLYKKVQKQLELFQSDPQHPSLRIHKLSGDLQNTWSISIDKNHRMLYQDNDSYYFFELGTHDQVYKK